MADPQFTLAPIPRRPRPPEATAKPGNLAICVQPPGEPPSVISLPPRLAGVLDRLAEAGPDGLGGGDPRLRKHITDLRAAGVPVIACRAPRSDGGRGWTALYRLDAGVEVARV